jgi:hypothetical protein
MILLALIVIWFLLIAFVAALCRIAAITDDRDDAAITGRYPSRAAQPSEAKLPGRIAREGRLAPAERDLSGVRVRGVRGRVGRFVA